MEIDPETVEIHRYPNAQRRHNCAEENACAEVSFGKCAQARPFRQQRARAEEEQRCRRHAEIAYAAPGLIKLPHIDHVQRFALVIHRDGDAVFHNGEVDGSNIAFHVINKLHQCGGNILCGDADLPCRAICFIAGGEPRFVVHHELERREQQRYDQQQ